ncbi:NAD(P)/FAD-dependent oxidoreductase [uncultured Acetobacteroides sp.]|uniref:phytoene desaturase family protein n=1 Tax=uncultured Acetobacteroides sp. TaxID=1760811 RepID=UPI0029F486CD|nr:NAD(P)/FAD-dependent oxidoreductase [uncultured Acetobacteroides sp.]
MSKYDVVIVGSGLGGLVCANMLSKEGYSVCVLEKNSIIGGCLQSFKRNGHLLDTGFHYIGSLDSGQILHQYFKYFGILDKIKLRRLDDDAFDVINYEGNEYKYAMGYDRFVDTLAEKFPSERAGLTEYASRIKNICGLIGVENLRKGLITGGGMEYFSQSASHMIEETVKDEKLRNILAGNVTLYGGERDHSMLYHHAMINGSNIEGAYRIVDGTQSVADAFVDVIRSNGGNVFTKSEVTRFVVENDRVSAVEVAGGERIEAKYFISNLHPAITLGMVEKTKAIKKAYLTRMNSMPNTYGLFTVHLIMKKNSFPYINRNYYLHEGSDAWYATAHPEDKRVKFALVCNQANSTNERYADVVTILCPMFFDEVAQWSGTTVERRGDLYKEFKQAKAEEVLNFAARYIPNLRENVEKIYTATPLTYRDYTATPEGSAYGIAKSYKNPLISLIPTKTKIDNLLLTGQNLNVHGALGVTLTATLTCSELLGKEYLAKKIGAV